MERMRIITAALVLILAATADVSAEADTHDAQSSEASDAHQRSKTRRATSRSRR